MKFNKPTSFTVDTEESPSHLFQSQLLSKTNLSTLSQDPTKLMRIFQEPQSKEALFLRVKNDQLQEKVRRLEEKVRDLESNKTYLLGINSQYIDVINRFYCNQEKPAHSNDNYSKRHTHSRKSSRQSIKQAKQGQKRSSSCQKRLICLNQDLNELKRLEQLEKDHRNLSKHCLAMEDEIKNYSKQMEKFIQMKAELYAVNHTSPTQLIQQLQEVVDENKGLKKQNNRLSFELEKVKTQCNKQAKAKEVLKKQVSQSGQQIQKLTCQINKVMQESREKSEKYQQRIYELELKVTKLENQLRTGQQAVCKMEEKRKSVHISRVQDVVENNYLRTDLSQLLDPKKHLLLSASQGFAKQRSGRNLSNVAKKSLSSDKKVPFIL